MDTKLLKKIHEKYKEIGTQAGVARALGIPRTTVRRYLSTYMEQNGETNSDNKNTNNSNRDISRDTTGDSFCVGVNSEDTLDAIYEQYGLDKTQWKVESISHNEWTTPFKNEDGEVEHATNTQRKVLFKKVIPDLTFNSIKAHYELMAAKSPVVPKFTRTPISGGMLLELAILDSHFGKLAWAMETGESYDIKIAKERYIGAVKDLLNKTCYLNIERIMMPIGNDLFNADGAGNMTTAGTPQDGDSRWTKVFRVVSETLIEVIDMCSKVAEVDVIVVPGNHDRASCFYLGEFLNAYYRNNENIHIDNSPMLRKYYKYEKTLIGLTHGSEERFDSLPLLMAREAKDMWSQCDFHEIHLGHYHKKKLTKYVSGDTFNGVVVRILESMSSTDFWHFSKGYTKGIRASTAIVFHPEDGYIAEFVSKIKDN